MTQEETFGSPQNQSAQETKDQSLGKRIVRILGRNTEHYIYYTEHSSVFLGRNTEHSSVFLGRNTDHSSVFLGRNTEHYILISKFDFNK